MCNRSFAVSSVWVPDLRNGHYAPALCLLIFLVCSAFVPVLAQAPTEVRRTELTITGTVRDKESKRALENVSVTLTGSSIGTVTNADGLFSLKIPHRDSTPQLECSHLGYLNTRLTPSVPTDANQLNLTVWMTPTVKQLDEVVVYGGNARQIVEEALRKIPQNYAPTESMVNAFYRETVQKGHRYIGISEAMMDVYKTPYDKRSVERDKVQLTKGRRLLSQKQSDTLAVKVIGGPNIPIYMDIVKNPDALFDEQTLDYYSFAQEPSTLLNNRLHYVISFHPAVRLDYALVEGKLYIDLERLSITRAEFSLDLSDREKAIAAILYKKPAGLRFRPQKVDFLITYRQHEGVTYLNYICNEIRFKCDWKRRFFSSSYTARSEMVVVEHEEHPERIITRREAFKPKQVFYDVVKAYWNEAFWKDYNIIEPTESLENAVKKLRKQLPEEGEK